MTHSATERMVFEEVSCSLCGSNNASVIARSLDYEYKSTNREIIFVRCSVCGHVYMNPRPVIDSAHLMYPSDYYTLADVNETFAHRFLQWIKIRVLQKRVRPLLDNLPPNAAVLETGAGDGTLSAAIRMCRNDLHVTALDLQFSSRTSTNLQELGVEVLEGALESVALDMDFDLIIMNQLIEHLWQPGPALQKLFRHTRSGGMISISTPSIDGYDRKWFGEGTWGGYYAPRHLNIYSPETLERLLVNSGYRVVSQRSITAPLVWMRNCLYSLEARRSRLAGIFTDNNLLAVTLFTILDMIMIALGRATSNQQTIAKRR